MLVLVYFKHFPLFVKIKPELIFSKGGFVSVPVVLAGKMAKVPVVIHESDVTPGLANKLALPFSNHIFTVFEQTLHYVPKKKRLVLAQLYDQNYFKV